jgi:hypothetical protein
VWKEPLQRGFLSPPNRFGRRIFMDETTPDMLAKYMVAKYKLGHIRLSAYLAAVLFEYIIDSKPRRNIRKEPHKITLKDKIDHLQEPIRHHHSYVVRNIFGSTTANNKLTKFNKLRNKIVHHDEINIRGKKAIEELEIYVWAELHPESFNKSISNINRTITIDTTITDKVAAYWVREIDHYTVVKESLGDSFKGIGKNDFEDLFILKKRILSLKKQLDNWLKNNISLELKTTPLTNIDTASAYIWLPMAQRKDKEPSRKRPSIYHSSVCITATPLDLRIHLGFGGHAIKDRRYYYQFLKSVEYREFIYELPESDKLKIFVIWYTFIERERMAPHVIRERDDFIKSIEKAKKKLDYDEKNGNIPVTWNKLINGYIIRRDEIGENVIDFDEITSKLKTVIELYSSFSKYAKSIEKQ